MRRTALHKCTEHRIATKLLAAGAKFNRLDKKHVSPLCFACLHNKFAVARVLLEWRADVNGAAPFAHSHTPLMVACHKGYHDIVALVRRARLRRPIPFTQLPRRRGIPRSWYASHAHTLCTHTRQLLKHGADWKRELSGHKKDTPATALAFAMQKQGHDGALAAPEPEPSAEPEPKPQAPIPKP